MTIELIVGFVALAIQTPASATTPPASPCAQAVRWAPTHWSPPFVPGKMRTSWPPRQRETPANGRGISRRQPHTTGEPRRPARTPMSQAGAPPVGAIVRRSALEGPGSPGRGALRTHSDRAGRFGPVAQLAGLQEEQGLLETAETTLLDARRQHPDVVEPYRLLAQFYARRATALHRDEQKTATAKPSSGPGEPDAQGIYQVGGGVTPPARLDVARYPPEAEAAGINGSVAAEVVMDPTGQVTAARIVRSIPMLDEAALAAVTNWRFQPTIVNGQPVPVRMTVTVNFTLRK